MRHAALPAANQAAAHPKLALPQFDAHCHELTDQVLLRPTPKLALSPQFPILHNALPRDEML